MRRGDPSRNAAPADGFDWLKLGEKMRNIQEETVGEALLRWGAFAALVVISCLVAIGIGAAVIGV